MNEQTVPGHQAIYTQTDCAVPCIRLRHL